MFNIIIISILFVIVSMLLFGTLLGYCLSRFYRNGRSLRKYEPDEAGALAPSARA